MKYFEWKEKLKENRGLTFNEHFMNCLSSENLIDDFLGNPNKWIPNLLFWFERNTLGRNPNYFFAARYKGWKYE